MNYLVSIAIEAALTGFFDAKDVSGKPMVLEDKGGCDACTWWDTHLEDITRKMLAEKTPGIPVFAEEAKDKDPKYSIWTRAQPKLWILDAIDGTPNFISGIPNWGKAIAYLENDDCLINAIAIPAENALYVAAKGLGTWRIDVCDAYKYPGTPDANPRLYYHPDPRFRKDFRFDDFVLNAVCQWNLRLNGNPLGITRLTVKDSPKKVQIAFDLGYTDREDKMVHVVSKFADLKNVHYPPIYGSASYGLCAVASGRLAGYMIIGVDMNDIYPGMLMVKERFNGTGRVVCDQHGNMITRASRTLCAAKDPNTLDLMLEHIRPAANNPNLAHIWRYRKAA